MYSRRGGSSFMHPSISAPALGREPPSLPERIWYRCKPSSDSRSGESSGASSPTTSLLLYMWGYDDTHALTRNREPGGYPYLLTNTSGSLHRRRLFGDSSFRRMTALVSGLTVVTCFAAVLLTAGSRFRPDTPVGEPVENSTGPVLLLGEQHLPFLPRPPVEDGTGSAAGSQPAMSEVKAVVLAPGRNVALSPGESNGHGNSGGSSILYSRGNSPTSLITANTTGSYLGFQAP